MKWSAEIARPFGIPLRVHASFALILAFGALQWSASHGLRGALFGAASTLALFACVALHELGHSVAARAYGLTVKEIVLLPIGGVAALEGKPRRPAHELVIALAGPLVNLAIAAILSVALFLAWRLGPLDLAGLRWNEPSALAFVALLLLGNLTLAAFNLLPFYPLDGGRVLRAALSFRMSEERATAVAAGVGQIGAVALGAWALVSGHLLLAAISVMMFFSAAAERSRASLPGLLAGLRAGDVCERGAVVLLPATAVAEARVLSMSSSQSVFPVALGGQLVGVVSRAALRGASPDGAAYVTGLMQREWLELDASAPLASALSLLGSRQDAIAAVRDEGRLVGFLSVEHILSSVLPMLPPGDAQARDAAPQRPRRGEASPFGDPSS